VEQPFLADHCGEDAGAQRQDLGVGAQRVHESVQPGEPVEPRAARAAPRIEIESKHADAEASGEEARRTGQARAHVEHTDAGADGGAAYERFHRGATTVVVVVQLAEIVQVEPRAALALPAERIEDLGRRDGVPVVEVDDVVERGAGRHGGHASFDAVPGQALKVPVSVWYKKAFSIRPIDPRKGVPRKP
jgi:hypothetical protein